MNIRIDPQSRISLDLWGILDHLFFDQDDVIWGEPNPLDYDFLGSESDRLKYDRHLFYFNSRLRYSGIGITILSVACLEAYVNELIILLPGLSDLQRKSIRKQRLREKYQNILCILSGQKFDTSIDPLWSFARLVNLRNALTHFDPTFKPDFSDIGNDSSFPDIVSHDNFPTWVRNTTTGMLRTLNELINDPKICIDPDKPCHVVAQSWATYKRFEEGI